jgi:hypothetical protein
MRSLRSEIRRSRAKLPLQWMVVLLTLLGLAADTAVASEKALVEREYVMAPPAPKSQSQDTAREKSSGCISCHRETDEHTMHANPAVVLGCTDCHGGDASVVHQAGSGQESLKNPDYRAAMDRAHVLPRNPGLWKNSANPEGSYAHLNREHEAFVRFINPGDLRVAREACGACHLPIIESQERSLMSTSAMLWGGAAYNNGILPFKRYLLGEFYSEDGTGSAVLNPVKPEDPFLVNKGVLDRLYPLPAWETVPPADIFRVFEGGGRVINSIFPELGIPNNTGQLQRVDEPGRPDFKQSNRGPGTGLRVAIPILNLTKTRLNDPHLWFLGTNDNPGDYRSSGCTACHVVYANDREPGHSGPYAAYGNTGKSQTRDPTIPKDRPGHPLRHAFTRAIPSSQCMVCHMHQPNIYVNSFYGYMQYDYEPDAARLFPAEQHYPSDEEIHEVNQRNPEEAVIRGNWRDRDFLKDLWLRNDEMKHTQFADYHGHGWVFRAVHKRNRKGQLLDAENRVVADEDPDKFKKTVHMASIHLDKGMHCVDCHFSQDMHGNGHIYGEVAAAIEIDCADCHGTARNYPTLHTSGPAAQPGGRDLSLLRTQDGRPRFEWRDGKLYQRAALDPNKEWEVSLVKDSVNPVHPDYNGKAARAKLMAAGEAGRSGKWGEGAASLAHDNEKMTCYTCHTSWTTSCAGCHLPIQANRKTERNHYEGKATRNYATYNVQVARDDVFQLGVHGPVKRSRIAPFRSSSALVLSSQNANRERIYYQQPPISASGFSSQAFAPHYPHTERKTETKTCSDCHVAAANDNNAIMAQLLLQGTNFVNFVGRYAWIGAEEHVEAVGVTEWDEPQAVIGSYLQKYAYPDWYAAHQKHDREIVDMPHREAANHHGTPDAARCLQMRGEYLFVAEGRGGLRVYDIAANANKGVSQRIITAPFSPLGHDTHVKSRNATCVALPTNQPIAPARNQGDLMRVTNEEQAFHPIYHYAYLVDAEEGLILVNVDTLVDGEARNNFLERALTWNPDGRLDGARHIVVAGSHAYITTPRGVEIISLDDPLNPKLLAAVDIPDARASALQFRYLYVTDAQGLRVVDVTHPEQPKVLPALIPLADAHRVYLARTYAYVAAGAQGLAIVDIERADQPKLFRMFDADGQLNDARDVVVGSTNASLFAYVADGRNGLKVIQLTSPESQPGFYGFSPEPRPELIATRRTQSPALALSKGLDRDRAVDETGHQIAVIGRIGARPFNKAEMEKLYLTPEGQPWQVTDEVRHEDYLPRVGTPPVPEAPHATP